MSIIRLPPMAAIRAFEAAARHENFTRAAEELGMSQASVSYQIKILEERLGLRLFLRHPRKVSLTPDGHQLATATVEAFERLRAAFSTAESAQQSTLAISTTPTFASNWLAVHLGRFQISHPDLVVRVDTKEHYIDFAREEVDVAIRYGDGAWPNVVAHELMRSEFTPMLSPGLLESSGRLTNFRDILKLQLISPEDRYWSAWLAAANIPNNGISQRAGSQLGSQTEEAQAAIAGHGVAMLSPRFFQYELATGRLVQPFDLVATDGLGHWLVYPEHRRNLKKIKAFRTWLRQEVMTEMNGINSGSEPIGSIPTPSRARKGNS